MLDNFQCVSYITHNAVADSGGAGFNYRFTPRPEESDASALFFNAVVCPAVLPPHLYIQPKHISSSSHA